MQPKYPTGPLIIARTEYNSENKKNDSTEYNKIYPIASISKSFSGITCSLMAIDGVFEKDNLDITLKKILNEIAKNNFKNNPKVTQEINSYLKLLKNKNIENITLKQILTHTSGIHTSWNNDTSKQFFAKTLKGKKILPFEYFNSEAFLGKNNPKKKTGEYCYSNDAFMLLEEILNFVSKNKKFLEECQNRIIKKLNLSNTKFLEGLNKEEGETIGVRVLLPGQTIFNYTNTDDDKIVLKNNTSHPTSRIPILAGGICSTINDLKQYTEELGRLYTGLPNKLTNGKTCQKIQEMFWKDIVKTEDEESYGYGIFVEISNEEEIFFYHYGQISDSNFSLIATSFRLNKKLQLDNIVKAVKEGSSIKYFGKQMGKYHLYIIDGLAVSIKDTILNNISKILDKETKKQKEESLPNNDLSNQIELEIFQRYHTKEGLFDNKKFSEKHSTMGEINKLINELTNMFKKIKSN